MNNQHHRTILQNIAHRAMLERSLLPAIVTGASEKGTWVRILSLPIEGKLVKGFDSMDVGGRLRGQLIDTNVERCYIDFKKVNAPR